MTKSEVRDILLVEAHRILNGEAKRVVEKIGKPIPEEARPGYLTDEDISVLKEVAFTQPDHPIVRERDACQYRADESSFISSQGGLVILKSWTLWRT